MSTVLLTLSWALVGAGLLFFISGSAGLLRFPDIYCRLHAVTKADTLGLGLICAGLAVRAEHVHSVLLLFFVWLVVIASSAVTCQLLARFSRTQEQERAGTDG